MLRHMCYFEHVGSHSQRHCVLTSGPLWATQPPRSQRFSPRPHPPLQCLVMKSHTDCIFKAPIASSWGPAGSLVPVCVNAGWAGNSPGGCGTERRRQPCAGAVGMHLCCAGPIGSSRSDADHRRRPGWKFLESPLCLPG